MNYERVNKLRTTEETIYYVSFYVGEKLFRCL